AGHTDVVPVGNLQAWHHPPFAANIEDGKIYGRGAVDMKCAIACFISAVAQFLKDKSQFPGSISLLITGDEEAIAEDGTKRMLPWLKAHNEIITDCLIGEPTSRQ